MLGPNGVGKSTLVKALLGLVPLSAGTAEVLGAPPGEAGDRIGYLPQRRSFDPEPAGARSRRRAAGAGRRPLGRPAAGCRQVGRRAHAPSATASAR